MCIHLLPISEVETFLETTEKKLDNEFNRTAQFPNCQKVLMWAGEHIAEKYADMRNITVLLCNPTDVIRKFVIIDSAWV